VTAFLIVMDGNKLTIAFDMAGEKRVVDSFVKAGVTRRSSAVIVPSYKSILGRL
jgi:hypothetical protein